MNPIALTRIPDKANPFARIVVSSASAGMTPWSGVYVNENKQLNKKLRQMSVLDLRIEFLCKGTY